MEVTRRLGITPEHYSDMKLSEFLLTFKGRASEERLKEVHKECIKLKKTNK